MPSKNKTPNIGLNQWKGNEYAKREDFINDNLIIDKEIKELQAKADEVEQNAKNYTDTTAFKKVDKVAGKELSTEDYTTTDKNKLAGIQVGANKYVHPSKHSASIITQSATHRFTTDQEKAYWNGLESLLKAYADAATAGIVSSAPETLNNLNKLAQALNDDPDFANTIANQIKNKVDKESGKKLSSNDYTTSEKNKLANIQNESNKYVHPPSHPANMIAQNSTYRFVTDIEKNTWNSKETPEGSQQKANIAEQNAKSYADSIKPTKTSQLINNNGYITTQRAVSDSTSSTSSSTAASSKAVKTAYDKANQAFQSASNGKSKVATAITGMGQSASSSDSFSTLSTKIKNISKDANAATSTVLTGKTFYQGGIKRIGTMANRGSKTFTPNSNVQTAPSGYYNSVKVNPGLDYNAINFSHNRLYGCTRSPNENCEYNPDTLVAIKSVSKKDPEPDGIGGTKNRLYGCSYLHSKDYEYNPYTLVVIKSVSSTNTSSIGGTENRLYGCSENCDKRYEYNPDTLAIIKSVSSTDTSGIGGTENRLYGCSYNPSKISEYNHNTLAIIKSVSSTNPSGIGGTKNRLYGCCYRNDENYEYNHNTLATIKSVYKSNPLDIGGIFPTQRKLIITTSLQEEIFVIELNSDKYYKEELK